MRTLSIRPQRKATSGARPVRLCALVLALAASACAPRAPALTTPFEQNAQSRVSRSEEMARFLRDLAAGSPLATVVPIGRSANGVAMEALVLSREPAALAADPPAPTRTTVLLVGSQHGTEPSGGEALLGLARDVVAGPRADLLDDLNLILIPNGNPDGRDFPRRVNGNGVNLSTNFTTLSEPESRAVEAAMQRWRPQVLLDVHESAIFKGKSLAPQGYMTDFEAQFEVANHPNVDAELRALTEERLLPEVIRRVNAAGLRAHRYFGEITDVAQPITHGGLSVKNLRNKAGMRGMVGFLVENRLDPKHGDYPTPRNLGTRVDKQSLSVLEFLEVIRTERAEIDRVTRAAEERSATSLEPLYLLSRYALEPGMPEVEIRLRRIPSGELVERSFEYHGRVETRIPVTPPEAYVATAHQGVLRRLLDRHHLEYVESATPRETVLVRQRVRDAEAIPGRHGWGYTAYDVEERAETVAVPAGALWIPVRQPAGRMLPLLLDPRSNSSIFQEPAYAALVRPGEDLFIARVERDDAARRPAPPARAAGSPPGEASPGGPAAAPLAEQDERPPAKKRFFRSVFR